MAWAESLNGMSTTAGAAHGKVPGKVHRKVPSTEETTSRGAVTCWQDNYLPCVSTKSVLLLIGVMLVVSITS
jgi:hypothetical protein